MLRDLQTEFAGALFDERPEMAARVRAGRFPAAQHLQVYRNNVVESLTGALRAVYPVVEKLVGDGFFRYAVHEYLRAHRPRSGNLHDFGDAFASFLAGFAPAAELPYLPDVARLEWAWHQAFHAADAPAFDFARLGALPAEQHATLRFVLHPSARLLASDFPVVRIFEINQEGFDGDTSVDLAEGGVRALVIRRGLTVYVEPLAAGEAELLAALAGQQPLAAAVQAALAVQPEFDLTGTLAGHLRRGTLVDFLAE
jgi:Putative DNA-binding domain